jgi:hypothetical protein
MTAIDRSSHGHRRVIALIALLVVIAPRPGDAYGAPPRRVRPPAVVALPRLDDDVGQLAPEGGGGGIARGDFNGDGFGDLAIGVPQEDIGAIKDAGAVNVIYGSAAGLTATDPSVPASQFWNQDSAGVPDRAEANDHFGTALAAGDFNHDGFSDLAVGVPGEDLRIGTRNFSDVGAVNVFYGSAAGLTATDPSVPRAELWANKDFEDLTPDGRLATDVGDQFGASLVWADFNGDGIADLAIGVPTKILEPRNLFDDLARTGVVYVVFGAQNQGLTRVGRQVLHQEFTGPFDLPGDNAEGGDRFGAALAAGDFDADGFSDLAIGIPGETVGTIPGAGAVQISLGSRDGLTAIDNFFHLDSPDVPGSAGTSELFGAALAAADFNGDGKDDLAIGAPFDKVGDQLQAGSVTTLFGTFFGVTTTGSQRLTGDLLGTFSARGDFFGWALAAADFNADGKSDLAIGVPFKDLTVGGVVVRNAGLVNVVNGSSSGLTATGSQFWTQGRNGIVGLPEAGDEFGFSLTAWNFGFDFPSRDITVTRADLAIGAPGDGRPDGGGATSGFVRSAGAVNVIYGGLAGLAPARNQFWSQASPGIPDEAEPGDQFGMASY